MVHYACCFCLVISPKLDFRVHLEKVLDGVWQKWKRNRHGRPYLLGPGSGSGVWGKAGSHVGVSHSRISPVFSQKKAHLPVGQAWQISSCLRGQVRGPHGDVWVLFCPDGLCQTGGEGLWVL